MRYNLNHAVKRKEYLFFLQVELARGKDEKGGL